MATPVPATQSHQPDWEHPLLRFVLNAAGFAILLLIWRALTRTLLPLWFLVTVAIVGLALVPIVAKLARLWLDRRPTQQHMKNIAILAHYGVMLPLGSAIICAVRAGIAWPLWTIPIPPSVSYPLLWICGIFTVITVLNLAIRAWGAPFAIALSRRLATDWLYARVRNPMVLACVLYLLSAALWLRSASLLLWVVVGATPAWIAFLKIYEERELELRFGQQYLDYKTHTPMLFPHCRSR
jgi:protein-S-isoprenylcysteine O-methyltransferase Ste14